jgi:hypothetical protein
MYDSDIKYVDSKTENEPWRELNQALNMITILRQYNEVMKDYNKLAETRK